MRQQIFEVNAAGMYSEVKGGCAGKLMDEGRKILEGGINDFEEAHLAIDLLNRTMLCMMGENNDFIDGTDEESKERKDVATHTDATAMKDTKPFKDDEDIDVNKHEGIEKAIGVRVNQILRGSKDKINIISIPTHLQTRSATR